MARQIIVPNKTFKKDMETLAIAMSYHCVRNTVIEDWHAEGRISDPEMKEFMIEVVSKIYTTLVSLDDVNFAAAYFTMADGVQNKWDKPKIRKKFVKSFQEIWQRIDKRT